MQAKIYKDIAKEIFNTSRNLVSKYMSNDPLANQDPDWDKDETFAHIEKLIDLNHHTVKFAKTPRDQEASVAAVFFECIGNGIIKDITPLYAGYKNKYDLYAKWGAKKVVIEFKSYLSSVLKDFSDEQKMFNEINCIVCWDVSEIDLQEFKNRGMVVEPIDDDSVFTSKKTFPSATHTIGLSGFVTPVYVIDLKLMLEASAK